MKAKFIAAIMLLMFAFSWYPVAQAQIVPVHQDGAGEKPVNPNAWDWNTDMDLTATPAIPGLGGSSNPDHLTTIKITLNSKNGKPIDQAKINFMAVAWDPTITQSGLFYMNSSTGTSPSTTWYIEIGKSYFYREPWSGQDQEDAYDTRLMVTAGSNVKFNITAFSKLESPAEIKSQTYNYTVEGSWYRLGSTDSEMFKNNIDVKFSPSNPMMGDSVQVTMTVKAPPPGRSVKPMMFIARLHVSIQFFDSNQNDINDMQIEAAPMQPNMAYVKTATISDAWHYKPGIRVTFWAECWQEATKRYYHITSYPSTWGYTISEAGLWKYPPPKGTFDQNVVISVKPNVIQNPDAAIGKDSTGKQVPGCGNITVSVESKYADVPLYPAKKDPKNPYKYYQGSMLWYTIQYEDGFGLTNETGAPKYFPVLPTILNTTKLVFTIPPMQARLVPGEVMFYVEAWNLTRQKGGVLYTDAHPTSPDTFGTSDPYQYNIAEAAASGHTDLTSFVVWVYDDRFDMKYVSGVNVTYKNGSMLNVPVSTTQTNSMGWCYPSKPGGNEPLMMRFGDKVLVEVAYNMPLGGGSSKKITIKANYTYTIERGKQFKNTTLMREYIPASNIHSRYIYYIVISEMPNVTANIFFKFNWKPVEPPPIFAEVEPFYNSDDFFDSETPMVMAGTIASVAVLGPVVWMLDKRRKKAEEEEKRVTL